jgi:hypothetical protein
MLNHVLNLIQYRFSISFFLLLLREILKQVQDDTLIMLNITAEARFKPSPARLSLRPREGILRLEWPLRDRSDPYREIGLQ